jgi:hypothetical protein
MEAECSQLVRGAVVCGPLLPERVIEHDLCRAPALLRWKDRRGPRRETDRRRHGHGAERRSREDAQ